MISISKDISVQAITITDQPKLMTLIHRIYPPPYIWMEAMDNQNQALRFYEKCGYEILNTKILDLVRIHKKHSGMFIIYKSLV